MSRSEADREDLLREATALVERAELTVSGYAESIVVGFRGGGSISFYFGGDPAYQFNTESQLRRAYIDGLLYKAEHGRLIALRRERNAQQTALIRCEADEVRARELLESLRTRLDDLRAALASGSFTVQGEIPSGSNIVSRVLDWLSELPTEIGIAPTPNVR